jgi:CrcB protein
MNNDGPMDSDAEVGTTRGGRPLPIHLNWRYLGIVFVGGAFGTAAREGLALVIPSVDDIPLAIFVINVVGAFLLGLLIEALSRGGTDEGRRRGIRLLIGTGFLGGFTTYSTLAVGTSQLAADGNSGLAVAYSIGTIVIGALASWAGIAAGAGIHRRRASGNRASGNRATE